MSKSLPFAYVQIAKLEVEDFIAIVEKLEEHGEKPSKRKKLKKQNHMDQLLL